MGTAGRLIAPEPLILVGSGGFGRETAEAVRAINAAHDAPPWELLGFLDDDPARWGTEVSGTPVLGAIETLADRPDARVVVCTGHPGNFSSKRAIVERTGLAPERCATLVHPAAVIPPSCALGAGTVVLAGVVATVDVQVGRPRRADAADGAHARRRARRLRDHGGRGPGRGRGHGRRAAPTSAPAA